MVGALVNRASSSRVAVDDLEVGANVLYAEGVVFNSPGSRSAPWVGEPASSTARVRLGSRSMSFSTWSRRQHSLRRRRCIQQPRVAQRTLGRRVHLVTTQL